jgi:SagB-type dehydrogenase family enzyme
LGDGLYYYDPLNHRFGRLSGQTATVEQLLAVAARAAEIPRYRLQVLLVVAARFQRRAWKYASIAYSTILKDVGVLYQTMYLVATAMGLCPQAIPGGNSDLFASATDTAYYAETSVGEFLLGSKL